MGTRILFGGDWHANGDHAEWCFDRAAEQGASLVIVCGDFGWWPHKHWGQNFLDRCQRLIDQHGIDLWFIDGNHDKHPGPDGLFALPLDAAGFGVAGDRFRYIPRGTRFTLDDVEFIGHGGAWSVDWADRTPGDTWWPEEEITEADIRRLVPGKVDVLITHDAPWGVEVGYKDGLRRSINQRLAVSAIADLVQPSLVVHGHHHRRYVERYPAGFDVVGLGRDGSFENSILLLDTEVFKANK